MGVFMFTPTWSSVWEKHPISIIELYRTETVLMATLLREALSHMNAITWLAGTESSVERVAMSWRAISSPVIDFASNIRRQTCHLILPVIIHIPQNNYHRLTDLCSAIKNHSNRLSGISCTSFSRMKGMSCLNLDESLRENACSSRVSQKLSTFASGIPAFKKAVTNSCSFRQILAYWMMFRTVSLESLAYVCLLFFVSLQSLFPLLMFCTFQVKLDDLRLG